MLFFHGQLCNKKKRNLLCDRLRFFSINSEYSPIPLPVEYRDRPPPAKCVVSALLLHNNTIKPNPPTIVKKKNLGCRPLSPPPTRRATNSAFLLLHFRLNAHHSPPVIGHIDYRVRCIDHVCGNAGEINRIQLFACTVIHHN